MTARPHRRTSRRRVDPALARVASAWEHFASGANTVEGVRLEIVESWRRSRDDFQIDPSRDRTPARDVATLPPRESVVAAQLGAVAMEIASDVAAIDGLVAIADGEGRILGAWGDEAALHHAGTQNLDPLFVWREETIGTTGVGTALELSPRSTPIEVSRFEHWCEPLQEWSCAAATVRHPSHGRPLGVIDISIRNRPLPIDAIAWLERGARRAERRLRASLTRGREAPGPIPTRRRLDPGPRRIDDRLVGRRDERLIVIAVREIRSIEIAEGEVWLDTDDGRLRSAARTLDELEHRLSRQGFMRVNRHTLVNLRRTRELAPSFKGGLWLLVEGSDAPIAVSRRRLPELRERLGL